ncbi:MAG: 30S ribosomal protein S21 [Schleiferiaceae bacterium]|jgi:small subunit ribosomal protein S21|nr:30S ribosomal protein S21 [Schleiferiaceae bacterium]MDP4626688.1 30S ribosomal protein S21 [Schleiferiaceae bacterium]MDP4728798.1 30S ribosomal protein S21 [Schleiferiaceae bacterium]MDP4749321.1 30S ribosomal protein S21 [Schleiferiaceae bacterium]MDP4859627.1 30S ribosomal protein S21 [Schleiferiaceae bacterium]
MLVIQIKEGEGIDRALKRYKRKFDKTGTMRQLRSRQAFQKKSISRRMEVIKAAYVQNMRREEME